MGSTAPRQVVLGYRSHKEQASKIALLHGLRFCLQIPTLISSPDFPVMSERKPNELHSPQAVFGQCFVIAIGKHTRIMILLLLLAADLASLCLTHRPSNFRAQLLCQTHFKGKSTQLLRISITDLIKYGLPLFSTNTTASAGY